jgi:hypothetical protein
LGSRGLPSWRIGGETARSTQPDFYHRQRCREATFGLSSCLAKTNDRLNSLMDPKIIHPVPRNQLRGQPARFLTATGPSLEWSRRILEFRENLRIRSTLQVTGCPQRSGCSIDDTEAPFKFPLSVSHSSGKC